MKVLLAGYNVDANLLGDDQRLTPETLSAAYARISRSALPVDELRAEALGEVAKARRSNQAIVFDMGHSSVAEHAVFNFDIIGISRLLAEWVQRSRLASFTEKSQRYVTLHGDWVCPPELDGLPLADELAALIERQNELYHQLLPLAINFLHDSGIEWPNSVKAGRAREDARYVLSLATQTQMGMTLNARSLQRLLRRLDRCPLAEAATLRRQLEAAARAVAPSLVRYTSADSFERRCYASGASRGPGPQAPGVRLLHGEPHADKAVLTALMFEQGAGCWGDIESRVLGMSDTELRECYDELYAGLQPWHAMPRAFEAATFRFELAVSSCCFGQLKRHRMATLLVSGRSDRIFVPPLLRRLHMDSAFVALERDCASLAQRLDKLTLGLGDYARTNAHLLGVVLQANLRELHHFSRLRSDRHAQWEVRRVSGCIDALARRAAPLAARWMMGKHELEKARA
ncbi:MAG: FAD-dependent thymidylate synthase [Candidatus Cloacimonetes bacterium]|nr:FAD-dependent thymidylate synthase [Candidatus Cloacimonadota bacterium]